MYKKLAIAAASAAMSVGSAHALTAGDIAFTGFGGSSSTSWGFSFVSFVDIAANTTVYFTDTNINASGMSATKETIWSWTSGSALAAGTVVAVPSSLTASVGTLTAENSVARNMAGNTETLFAYVGSATSVTTTLAAISNRLAGTSADDPVATGLTTSGASASAFFFGNGTSLRYAQFNNVNNGTTYASADDLRSALMNSSNWTVSASSTTAMLASSGSLISAVPEPSTYAMLLAGLGMMGVIARRRTRA